MRAVPVLLLLAFAGCAAPAPGAGPSSGAAAHALPTFGPSLGLPGSPGADEPSLIVSPDGTVLVCAPVGLGAGTEVWRSLDAGRTFERIGASTPAGATYRDGGAGAGGGDCDVAADAAGGLYLADLSGAGLTVAHSTDKGATWATTPIPVPPTVDRPWVAGGAAGEVVVIASGGGQTLGYSPLGTTPPPGGGIWFARSTDGGKTFGLPTKAVDNAERADIYGRPIVSPDGVIRFLYPRQPTPSTWEARLATSRDHGATWTTSLVASVPVAPASCDLGPIFPSLAADARGRLYAAWSMDEPTSNRTITVYTASPDGGVSWKPLAEVDLRGVASLEAWVAATPSGRVGIAYYEMAGTVHAERIAGAPVCEGQNAPLARVMYAEPADPLDPAKGFRSTSVSVGDTSHRLGDLLNVAFDRDGHALVSFIAGNDTSNVHVARSLG